MDQRSPRFSPTVYIVEDDPAVRSALAFLLEMDGFATEIFDSGEALLLRTDLHPAGCLMIDERLPGISGLETLRQLRARNVATRALLITSHPKPSLRAAAAAAATPILEKPLDGESLIAAIRNLLDSTPAPVAGTSPG